MAELAHPLLSGWDNFYVIVGSSGGALIGLQFVVITLIADTHTRGTTDTISAFGTPTIVHLGAALLVSAIMSAPWPSLVAVAIALAVCGIAGIGYCVIVISRARRQKDYEPVFEDWLWHMVLPCCAYAALTLAALSLHTGSRTPLFIIAGAALGLLFIAIHNAWDTVIYIAVEAPRIEETKDEQHDDRVATPGP
jgi:amino acid transporter